MLALVEIALDFLLSVVIDLFLIWTGEVLLWCFTLGKRKPAFRFWKKEQPSRLPDLLSVSALMGLLFWIVFGLWWLG